MFDLLGDPIPDRRGAPGRTGHIATAENVKRVRQLLVAGLKVERIAEEIGITSPTLRKHYFRSGKVSLRHARDMAVAEARAVNLLRLEAAADKGNVGAMRHLTQIYDRAELQLLDDGAAHPAARRAAAPDADGKKGVAHRRALDAEEELARLFTSDRPH